MPLLASSSPCVFRRCAFLSSSLPSAFTGMACRLRFLCMSPRLSPHAYATPRFATSALMPARCLRFISCHATKARRAGRKPMSSRPPAERRADAPPVLPPRCYAERRCCFCCQRYAVLQRCRYAPPSRICRLAWQASRSSLLPTAPRQQHFDAILPSRLRHASFEIFTARATPAPRCRLRLPRHAPFRLSIFTVLHAPLPAAQEAAQ